MATAQKRRAYRGPAILSFGFRPFFLGASLWAAFAVAIWITSLALGHADIGGRPGLLWHMDEMLFGFVPAVFAGFLLTAVPNWTGRLPVTGLPLAMLFGVWASGRLASIAFSQLGIAAPLLDLAFLFVFAGLVWREVLSAKNWRNLPVCLLVTVLAFAHLLFHLRDALPTTGDVAERIALGATAGMIALIGGRIVPSFTRNWLTIQGRPTTASATPALLDRVGLALVGVAVVSWIAAPVSFFAGASLAAAGIATLARLARWQGLLTRQEPLVWILHVGYAWLGLAFIALGASALAPELVPPSAGIHALTTGAAGVMILAVMTRASLGHTGQSLAANRPTLAAYLLVNAAAILRVGAACLPSLQIPLLVASAVLWALAFATFAFVYGPLFMAPRKGQPA